jgi:CelD/BcsL family acetyltransferase involved in cellulose biosynthesis
MKVSVLNARELGHAERQLWSRIQHSDPSYASPCLSPHFTCAASTRRDDIFIGILETANRPVGFFPFVRNQGNCAEASKQRMADYEGVIVRMDAEWTAEDLLRGCGLSGWEFEALIGSHAQLQPYRHKIHSSPILDLSNGFERYKIDLRSRGSGLLKKLDRQREALERAHGPIRFEPHVAADSALRWLMCCKSQHYLRTGFPDHFATPWVAAFAECVHSTQEPDFAGTLSVLYAGGQIVAAHLGARSRSVWHCWLPCYDRRFSKFSPGSLLLIEMARRAEALGMRYIDLSQGVEAYKLRFMNGSVVIAAGSIALH